METTIIAVAVSVVALIASIGSLAKYALLFRRKTLERRMDSEIKISIERADGSKQQLDLKPEDEASIAGFLDALKEETKDGG